MKRIFFFLLFLADCTGCGEQGMAKADEWSLQINSTSIHHGECEIKCNQDNRGLGIQRDHIENGVIKTLTVGTLINSINDRSYYAGGAYKYQRGPLSAGVFGGLVYYKSDTLNLWPALLPIASLYFKHFGINALYIPTLRKDAPSALFF